MKDKIKITSFEDGIIVAISGDLDSLRVMAYRSLIVEEIEKNNAKYIMWDFSNLSFLDSSGIGLILGRYNEIRRLGGACGIMGLTGATRKIIQMTGLFGIIEEYRSLAAFKKKVRINIWTKWKLDLVQV